ncbi:glycine-rich RNA-binding protein 5, mitochondrial-like [Magnolia sinica]|uniref:glycine-rich RNA-binding protein 5, mitochondrial-like n=1 Tax=Magnolia sinica TaxID=86752 RepID=UPI002659BE05|nr:glycine-rich RNA-binding protein 5, mitochondrial-like [Magnolia sinica]
MKTSGGKAIRCMSSFKLFIGGLSYRTDDQRVVIEARVIMDSETGRSRGFGFVSFTSTVEAFAPMEGRRR